MDVLPNLLCVDDDPSVLAGLARTLRRQANVVTADTPQAALDTLATQPFAVIISDMRMPGTTGTALLSVAEQRSPDTVRILLTGHADVESAIAAINDGKVFRFLTKPCTPDVLIQAFTAALDQHHLLTAQRDLMERTLRGAVQALLEVLAMANPAAFTRATRVRRVVRSLTDHLRLPDWWAIEVAAMLCHLGAPTLPPYLIDKLHTGSALTADDEQLLQRLPVLAEDVLSHIPRLEDVRLIIAHATVDSPAPNDEADTNVTIGARLLRVALAYDQLDAGGATAEAILNQLRRNTDLYGTTALNALSEVLHAAPAQRFRQIETKRLQVGMLLSADLRATNGVLLLGRGQELTPALMDRIRNFARSIGVEPVAHIATTDTGSGQPLPHANAAH